MSGESTDHAQDPDDTSPVEPAAAALPAAARTTDEIVPAFDVPAPELVDVPDAETAAADFAVPPPPTFETPTVPPAPGERAVPPPSDATWSSERTWKPNLTWKHDEARGDDASASDAAPKRESVQEKLDRAAPLAASSRASLRSAAASNTERPAVVPPPIPEDTSYRGWTIVIFSGLAVLFFGAVGLMVFLGLSG